MTREALKHGAVNLGQGFPDFAAPEDIKQKAMEAIADDHNQYAITCATSTNNTAESHVHSGVSPFTIPHCHPTASNSKDRTALPRKTVRSIWREKSQ